MFRAQMLCSVVLIPLYLHSVVSMGGENCSVIAVSCGVACQDGLHCLFDFRSIGGIVVSPCAGTASPCAAVEGSTEEVIGK